MLSHSQSNFEFSVHCKLINFFHSNFSFKCPDFSTYDPNKCYVKGREFNFGDSIHGDMICQESCHCSKGEGGAKIVCALGECIEDEYNPNCIEIYGDVKSCCRSSKICGKISFIISCFDIFTHCIYFLFDACFFIQK